MQKQNRFGYLASGGLALFLLCLTNLVQSNRTDSSEANLTRVLRHDFGEVIGGTRKEYTFSIKNNLKNSITPRSATASCRCVTVKLGEREYQPGETVNVEVALDTKDTSNLRGRPKTPFFHCHCCGMSLITPLLSSSKVRFPFRCSTKS